MEIFELLENLRKSDENLIQSVEELDKAINHIVSLIQDSSSLYINESYPSSTFLSISACEEVAKASVGHFSDGQTKIKGGRNVFRNHKAKIQIAAMPTIPMGQRLVDALGEDDLHEVMRIAQNGSLVKIRESALYFERENGHFSVPSEKIHKKLARSLLLFTIEVFDDALVGLTNHSFDMDDITDAVFEKIKNT